MNLLETFLLDSDFVEYFVLSVIFFERKCVYVYSRLTEELKQQNPDFPNVTSGIYVHEVVPHSPAQK